jgi:two-component system LytT family response regulator
MNLRVLIAEDEPLGRDRLRRFLESEEGTEIVAEVVTGTEAVLAIRREAPDVVFLDVKMPELDGFGVLASLDAAQLPAIIFVTAHDEFAVRAFEAHAVDYLLKPFDRERFQTALERARQRLRREGNGRGDSSLAQVMTILGAAPARLERITIRSHGRIAIVQTAEIDWMTAAGNYVELHVGKAAHLVRMTIRDLTAQLPQHMFVQISRSQVVNVERIKEVRPRSHGDYLVLLRDGTRLAGTRNYRDNLARIVGKPG